MQRNSPDLPAILGGEPVRSEGPPEWPFADPAVAEALQRAVDEGTWGKYHGPNCEELAERLAADHECEHVVLCSSGTVAVELALRGLRIGDGDEVILAAYDFKGNFQDVLTVGATPVLVDVDPGNWNLDPDGIEAAISPTTKAIIVSHLHGGVVPMPKLMDVARAHRLPVIEDACQMPGAVLEGRKIGTWGDVGILSFGGSKLLSAGRGGAFFTNDPDIVQRARLYSHRGNEAYPLSELQAAALIPQLNQLEARNRHRADNVDLLHKLLSTQHGLTPFRNRMADSAPGYYKLGFQYDPAEFGELSRDVFSAAMRAEGIALDAGFRSLHDIHSGRRYRKRGDLPNATQADKFVLTLHHPVLLGTDEEIRQIRTALDKIRRYATMISNRGRGTWTGG